LIAVTHVAERLVAGLNENANFEVTDEHFQEALHHLGITLEELEEIRELLEHEGSRV
jgi:hypothetical protein